MTIFNKPSLIKYCMIGFLNYAGDARVRGYAELLRKGGCMVDVLGLHNLETREFVDEIGVRLFSIPVPWTRKNRIRYMLEYGHSFLLLSFLLTKLYFKNRYDIIHVHNMPDFLVFCGFIPKLFGAKIILDIHDPMPEVYASKFTGRENSLGVKLLRFEEKFSTIFSDAVITANIHFTDNLISRGIPASKITTINNYPDPEIFNKSKRLATMAGNHNYFTLIFPGTIAPRYGLEVAIKAMPLLKDEIPNVRLLIIGRLDEYVKSLIALAEKLGVSKFVKIRKGLPIKEIPRQLAEANVGIYPALPDSHMSIAIPGKVLEFAIMGLPILSSRLQIIEELFGDSAVLYFEPGNVEQFAQCVIRLYKDPSLRLKLVQQADRMFLERQSQEREVQAYWNLIHQLLSKRKQGLGFFELPQ